MKEFYLKNSLVLVKKIESYNSICIFRHVHPDCDALGSQFGLYTWLKTYFPEKKVYALGFETSTQFDFPALDVVEDEVIEQSLAIVVDTANQERVDDQRFLKAKEILKIDHHLILDDYGNTKIILEGCAATCQILTLLFHTLKEYPLTKEIATYLYTGILTDSLNFTANYTDADTLLAASYLLEQDLEPAKISQRLFDQDLMTLKFKSFLLSKMEVYKNHIAYVVLEQADLDEWNISASEARSKVNTFSGIQEFWIWALFTYDKETGLYAGSLRSKQVAINEVVNKYQGGGHKNACGVKNLSKEDISRVLSDLQELF
ncbi:MULTISPECIES: bifunctional oligoribonuclease/PAP phosphatase NrnA [Terrabacteria group]|uniref:DHH family phosphoesterase n=1 Tax=Bacillati TaxID=1783272 RepID=UPI001C6E16B7|nr:MULTISPECIES: bifunctional oligoribonuclease/PAP phosphatase NrnA [Terrabacteria group]MBW9211826.1 bifunctional oligoribonuclease/PAP phosphatase NrnA [Trueperella sp. zg.1013]